MRRDIFPLKETEQEETRIMDRKIRIGIHGCGRGQDFIRLLSLLTDKAEIVALCDNRERTLHRAKELCVGDPRIFSDFDNFIRCDMDGVILCNFFHEHVSCAVKALERGIAVLSETTAASTLSECVQLVRAVEKTGGKYMLAENYPFFCANQEIKRIYDTGSLGRVLYAEGEYCHPMSKDELNYAAETPDHWRAWLPKSYYLTHSLGPLMYITGEIPVTVNCRTVFAPELFEGTDRRSADAVSVMLSQTESGALFRFTGTASYAPHGDWYRIAGTKGGAETLRGDETRVRVAYNWWNVPDGEETERIYRPAWNEDGELAEKAGHNGGDYWVIRQFLSYITNNVPPFFDVFRAVTMSAVGILAWRSSFENGKEYRIPDFRREEERKLYENDNASPFPGAENQCVPPCSQPYDPAVI